MTTEAESKLEARRAADRERQRRWRAENPDIVKARGAATQRAKRLLRSHHEDEYQALMAELRPAMLTADSARQKALTILCQRYPDEWQAIRQGEVG